MKLQSHNTVPNRKPPLMTTILNIATLLMLTSFLNVKGQTFDRTYQGWWATTSWTFEFKTDGTYKRISVGHYGYTTVTGNYKVNQDTIQLLSGFKETLGTVNEKYLIKNDSLIQDLRLFYVYKLITVETNVDNSSNRYGVLRAKNPRMRSVKFRWQN